MSPELGVVVMMNNYFHDVATALLLASAAALWIMIRAFDRSGSLAAAPYLLEIHRRMTKVARFSLAWIVLGGIPRTIFYVDFEWANAAGRMQVPALVVKHILVFAFVGGGVWLWRKLKRRMREIEAACRAQDAGGERVGSPGAVA